MTKGNAMRTLVYASPIFTTALVMHYIVTGKVRFWQHETHIMIDQALPMNAFMEQAIQTGKLT